MSEIEQTEENQKDHHSSEGSTKKKVTITEQKFQGPLPPAVEFARYEETLAGSADRIMAMAEKDQSHTQKMQRREQLLYYASKFFAQIIVLLVSLGALGMGTYLITEGNSATGIAMIIGSLATFGGVIIWGKQKYKGDSDN